MKRKRLLATLLSLVLALSSLAAFLPREWVLAEGEADLFFSEYIEGSTGFNKALELYNPGSTSISFNNSYEIHIFYNGKLVPDNKIKLTGTIGPLKTFVIVNSQASPAMKSKADLLTGSLKHNGNDAIVLFKNGEPIDRIGRLGENPNKNNDPDAEEGEWTGSQDGSVISTKDMTLLRKPGILQGDPDYEDPFNPSDQWYAIGKDNFQDLGFHSTNPCLLTFDQGDHGDLSPNPSTQEVWRGLVPEEDPPLPIPHAGYRFHGWEPESGQEDLETLYTNGIYKDATFTARYRKDAYQVTFYPGDHGSLEDHAPFITEEVEHGEKAPIPQLLPDTGYRFESWALVPEEGDLQEVTREIKATAQWKPISYTISYQLDGGTNDPANPVTYTIEDEIDFKPATKKGHSFTGWYDAHEYKISAISPGTTGPLTLSAHYEANQYRVSFDSQGGSDQAPADVTYGQPYGSLPLPDKAGHIFQGWYDAEEGGNKVTSDTIVKTARDHTLYAHWERKQVTISFYTACGSPVLPVTGYTGDPVPVPDSPTRFHALFVEWEPALPSVFPETDMVLTAVWDVDQNYIVFDTLTDQKLPPMYFESGAPITGLPVPVKEGHRFDGWYPKLPDRMPEEGCGMRVTAAWTRESYTLSFDTGGWDPIPDITLPFGDPIVPPEDPEKPCCTFLGWDPKIPATMPAKDLTITALWQVKPFTILFDTRGGSLVPPITQDFGTPVTPPPDPSKEGHRFLGWEPELPKTMPLEGMEVKAKWQVLSYTLTFDTGGWDPIPDRTLAFGDPIVPPKDPEKPCCTFLGWEPKIPATMPAKDLTITALWQVKPFTIIFDTGGGSLVPPITQDFGTPISPPPNPTKEGHRFLGWEPELPKTMPLEGMEVKAKWQVLSYTLTFDTGGWDPIPDQTLAFGDPIVPPKDPEKPCCHFLGWEPKIPATMPAKDLTITALWQVKPFTIVFDTGGGSLVPPITQDFGTPISPPPDPTKEGHIFLGWEPELPKTMPLEGMEVKAKWQVLSYTLTFNTGGWDPIPDQTLAFGDPIVPPKDPEKPCCTFLGWDPKIPATMPAKDLTITALWQAKPFTIVFDTGGGSLVPPISQDFGTPLTPPPDPTKEGHRFLGWEPQIPATMPLEGIVLNARWEVNQYRIHFDSAGGTPMAPQAFDYGSPIELLSRPYRQGHRFLGWEPDLPPTMPAHDLTLTARWEKIEDEDIPVDVPVTGQALPWTPAVPWLALALIALYLSRRRRLEREG